MATSFLPSADAPRPRRPPRSSGARRAQDARAQARCVQRLLGGFDALGHRGCRPTRLGAALAAALALHGSPLADVGDDGFRHPAPSAPPLPHAGAGGAGPGPVRGASPLQAACARMNAAIARLVAIAEVVPGGHETVGLIADQLNQIADADPLLEAFGRDAAFAAARDGMAAVDREHFEAQRAVDWTALEAAERGKMTAADRESRAAAAGLAASLAAAAAAPTTLADEMADAAVRVGSVVTARVAFDSARLVPGADENVCVVIAAGRTGVVLAIDADGDAVIHFRNPDHREWVYSTDFDKLDSAG